MTRKISKGEMILAGLSALVGLTALLLRLPYRAPLLNGVLTALALSALYLYLRMRLEIRVPANALLGLVIAVVLDIVGNQFGLFSRRIWFIPYDIITHFLTSGLTLMLVMWLLMTLFIRFDYRLPLGWIAFFSVTSTFSLAAYYEITELMDERWFGGHRIWSTRDTSQDLAADLVGAVIAAVGYSLLVRRGSRKLSAKTMPSR